MSVSNKPVVLVDVDGVLLNFTSRVYDAIYDQYGHVIPDHERAWDICGHPKLEPHRKAIEDSWGKPGFSASLKPYDGAIDGIKRLREIADVCVLTAHWQDNPTWVHERDKTLVEQFGFDFRNEIIHTHAKWRVHGNAFIDDKPANLERWFKRWHRDMHTHPFLWTQPYNADNSTFHRLANWDDAYNRVKERFTSTW